MCLQLQDPTALPGLASGTGNIWKLLKALTTLAESSFLPAIHANEQGLCSSYTSHGRSGNEIPLFGRLVAVADVYDALCSRRSYKEAWKEDEVLEELKKLRQPIRHRNRR